jgi:hypothetical protein
MATSVSAASATAVSTGTKAPRQFQGLFDVIPFKVTLEDDSLPAGASVADITVVGAEVGDFVLLAPGLDSVETVLQGWVQSADTVTVAIVSLQEVDASTVWATPTECNGIVLKPKGVFDSL